MKIKINLGWLYKIFKPVIFLLDEEFCHDSAIFLLKNNLIPCKNNEYKNLQTNFFDRLINNSIGLAAGFDKNADGLKNLSKLGFGFIEVGTATPRPQKGNPKPRLFRLAKHRSLVNRFGFNNKGCDVFVKNLQKHYLSKNKNDNILIGANIGKNKDTQSISDDYIFMLQKVYNYCDYIVVNISSPNTAGLRDLQNEKNLEILLADIYKTKQELIIEQSKNIPILLKLSPDIEINQISYICSLVNNYKIDGVILTNTTIQKKFEGIDEIKLEGGLSGKLLKEKSLNILKQFYKISDGKIPIISVGGIQTADDIKQRLQNGAFAVQMYSELVYGGFGYLQRVKKDLSKIINT